GGAGPDLPRGRLPPAPLFLGAAVGQPAARGARLQGPAAAPAPARPPRRLQVHRRQGPGRRAGVGQGAAPRPLHLPGGRRGHGPHPAHPRRPVRRAVPPLRAGPKARPPPPPPSQAPPEAMAPPPPIPGDLFAGLFRRYERAKERAGRIDFEDMLHRMLEGFERREDVAEEFRGQYRWFSVDEYQDTNPLQQALLEAWRGERRDLAVVGDEDQTIYTFTGATSEYLTGFVRRFPEARLVRLEDNYRSSPEVLALANRLLAATPGRGPGAGKRLVATRPSGPEPVVVAFENAEREVRAVVGEVGRLAGAGTDPDEVAILVRTNAQIPPFEEALAAAGVRYQVRGELFFRRTEVLR